MKRRKILQSIFTTMLLLILLQSSFVYSAAQGTDKSYKLGSGTLGGTYYPVAVGIESLSKSFLYPKTKIRLETVPTAGSGENLIKLRNNEVEFALMQARVGLYAWNAKGPYEGKEPATELRSISTMWDNVEHYVIRSSFSKTKTIADLLALESQKMAMGKTNSGAIGSNTTILENLGVDIRSYYKLVEYAGYNESANALEIGEIVGFGIPAGLPAKAVQKTFAAMGKEATLLSFSPEQAQQADGGLGLWHQYTIKKGTYPGIEKDIETIAQSNFLAVRADVDEEVVYQVTKGLYDHLKFLNVVHSATKEIALNKALRGLPMPLHPGAARYFKEMGLTIPEELVP